MVDLDELDKAILRELQSNARHTNRAVAAAVGVSPTTALDHTLKRFLKANRHYHIVEVVPYGPGTYVIWRWERSTASQGYQPDLGGHHGKRHAHGKAGHRRAGRRHRSGR